MKSKQASSGKEKKEGVKMNRILNIEQGMLNVEVGLRVVEQITMTATHFKIPCSVFDIQYSLGNINVLMHLQTQFPFRVGFDVINDHRRYFSRFVPFGLEV
ncbi:MAG: hypothetical protein JWQ30_1985 [Sediminibacterium sp.]|nr:hypothetical protein [Sediminibacterium sp.]